MSKKAALPDELLDAVSGGILTYQGKEIAEMESGTDGTIITMRDGSSATLMWNDETASRLSRSLSSFFETANEIDGKLSSEDKTFALEDYVK